MDLPVLLTFQTFRRWRLRGHGVVLLAASQLTLDLDLTTLKPRVFEVIVMVDLRVLYLRPWRHTIETVHIKTSGQHVKTKILYYNQHCKKSILLVTLTLSSTESSVYEILEN